MNQIVDKYKEFVSSDLPEKIHDDVVSAVDVTQFKNMRDLNKKIKDIFVEKIKAIT
jgi:ATP-dependent Clp protease ATP-binding subunit ClpC